MADWGEEPDHGDWDGEADHLLDADAEGDADHLNPDEEPFISLTYNDIVKLRGHLSSAGLVMVFGAAAYMAYRFLLGNLRAGKGGKAGAAAPGQSLARKAGGGRRKFKADDDSGDGDGESGDGGIADEDDLRDRAAALANGGGLLDRENDDGKPKAISRAVFTCPPSGRRLVYSGQPVKKVCPRRPSSRASRSTARRRASRAPSPSTSARAMSTCE